MLVETAYAKINLALHVRRRRPDGYHDIETIFAFCAEGDRVEATSADVMTLSVEGPMASSLGTGNDNLVPRAAEALRKAAGIGSAARLRLSKILPVAAGLGGGSADAAATLRVLDRLWEARLGDDRLRAIGAELGADVPACIASRTARGEGRGDRLELVEGTADGGLPVLLVNPGIALSTAEVFARWDETDRGGLSRGDPIDVARAGRNDLEAPARALVPAIGDLLDWLAARPSVTLSRMSGSGATCFALFERVAQRDAAAERLKVDFPGYWSLATVLR